MRFLQIIRIAFTNLRSNRMRSILTIMGISVGIASIVFLVSLGYGLQLLSIKKIANIEAINTLDVSPGKNTVQKIDQELVNKLIANGKIEKVSPLLALGTKIEYLGKKSDSVGNFVNDDFASLEGLRTLYGSFFSNSEIDIVVSTALLRVLDIAPPDSIGRDIIANIMIVDENTKTKRDVRKEVKILGVIQDDTTTFAYMPMKSISNEIGSNPIYNSLKVKVKEQSEIQNVKQEISSTGYAVTSIADTISQVQSIFKIVQIVLAFFGFVALLVASIGMFNTMTIALLERTRDIGIMKALGVKNSDVAKIFLIESAIIAFSGGLIGVLGGFLFSKMVNLIINLLAKSVGGEPQILFVLPIALSLFIVFFSLFVGLATGFYPSRRASRLNPLDALRYE